MSFEPERGGCIRVEATMATDEVWCLNDAARVEVRFVGDRGEAFAPAWGRVIAVFHDCPETGAEEPELVTIVLEVPAESLASQSLAPLNSGDVAMGSTAAALGPKIVLGKLVEPDSGHILTWPGPRRSRQNLN